MILVARLRSSLSRISRIGALDRKMEPRPESYHGSSTNEVEQSPVAPEQEAMRIVPIEFVGIESSNVSVFAAGGPAYRTNYGCTFVTPCQRSGVRQKEAH
jgi:hypothetical protein